MNKTIKKFLSLIFIMVISLTISAGCKKSPEAKDLWDSYVEAINTKSLEGVAKTFYSTSSTAYPKFIKDNTNEDGTTNYFDGISSVETKSFKYLVQSDVTSNKKWEKYASASITISLTASDGVKENKEFVVYFQSGEKDVWNFTNPVNITSYDPEELGNTPNDIWTNRTVLQFGDFKYKYVKDAENGDYIVIIEYTGNAKKVVVPSEIDGAPVKVIKSYAFYKYTRFLNISISTSRMKTLVLPEKLEKIEDYAFYQCKKLTELTIPATVKTIGGNSGLSFASCRGLKKITLNVDDSALYGEGSVELSSQSTDGISFSGAKNMYVGDIITLTEDSGKLVYWSVDNSDVVSIDRDTGVATAIKNGSATITAFLTSDPTKKATVKVTVTACPVLLSASSNSFDRCSALETFIINAVNPNCINTALTSFRLSDDVKIYVPQYSGKMYKNNSVWSDYEEQIFELK